MSQFIEKHYRIEWQICHRNVDQYERQVGLEKVLAAFPTREQAVANLPNFAKQHHHVPSRWVPLEGDTSYAEVHIRYMEVPTESREEFWRDKYVRAESDYAELLAHTRSIIDEWDAWVEDESVTHMPRLDHAIKEAEAVAYCCPHCGGEGWLWGYELKNANDETRQDDQTQYTCDYCNGTGVLKNDY